MREPMMLIASGMKRVGKTYQTCHEIQEYITPNHIREARKFLIFDVNNEFNDTQIRENNCTFSAKVLDIEDLPKWMLQKRVEVRRILALDKDGRKLIPSKMVERLGTILYHAQGIGLLVEDINKYLIGQASVDIIGFMCSNAHVDLDVYIHLQTLARITTVMWANTAVIRFHKQMDDVKRYEDRVTNAELFHIAQALTNMMYKTNIRFFCYVYQELNIIKGKFSPYLFKLACLQYLYATPSRLKQFQNRCGGGQKNRVKALQMGVKELHEMYYGNNKD